MRLLLKKFIYIYIILQIFTALQAINSQWLDAYIPDFKVNDDNLNSYQVNSQLGVDSAGNFVIVWSDARINPGESYPVQVYCQRYNKDGTTLGSNFRIGQDTASGPKITVLKNGSFIVTWTRIFRLNSIQNYEHYYQRFSTGGNPITQPLRVIDTSFIVANEFGTGLSISSDTLGRFVICWGKKPNTNGNQTIYFQRFDSSGIKIGTVDSVNEAVSNAEFPVVAMNKNGSFVIAWQDNRQEPLTTKYDIYMQRYNSTGVKVGSNVKVNDDINALMFRGGAKISTDGSGRIVVVWTDPRICSNGEVYYQLYDAGGNPSGINRKANSSPCTIFAGGSAVEMRSDMKFFIYFIDMNLSGREQSYGRRFDSLGNAIGNQYMVPAASPNPTNQRADAMKILNDRVYCTWTHFIQSNNNTDIWCNVRGFQNPDTVIGIVNISGIAEEYKLYPAYPNPFNPSTNIKFNVASVRRTDIKIMIYDITGREMDVLVNNKLTAGTYEVKWDASGRSSGVYFVKMSAGSFTDIQKIILIK